MRIDRFRARGIGLLLAGLIVGGGLGPGPPDASGASNLWAQHAPGPVEPCERLQAPATAESPTHVLAEGNPTIGGPRVAESTYLDPMASIIGDVEIGSRVYVAPFVSVRGDAGQPIHIGDDSNLQDGAVVRGLETVSGEEAENTYDVGGSRYSVWIGDRVSLAHGSHVKGPSYIEDDVFVGTQALVFNAHIGAGTVIEPSASIIGVHVPSGRYVPVGTKVTDQATADGLPEITDSYALRDLNREFVRVNTTRADGANAVSQD